MQSGLTLHCYRNLIRHSIRLVLTLGETSRYKPRYLDKLNNAVVNGGAISDDIKSVGTDINDFTKYLNQADSGRQAVIDTFYKLKDAGRTTGEITYWPKVWVLMLVSYHIKSINEVPIVKKKRNKINNESVIISEDTSAAFREI